MFFFYNEAALRVEWPSNQQHLVIFKLFLVQLLVVFVLGSLFQLIFLFRYVDIIYYVRKRYMTASPQEALTADTYQAQELTITL